MSTYNHIPINFKQAELIERDNAHFYQTPTGKTYPSITTILQETMPIGKKEGLQNWTDEEQQVLNKSWDQTQLGVAFCAIKPVPEEGEKHAVVAPAARTKSSKDEDE